MVAGAWWGMGAAPRAMLGRACGGRRSERGGEAAKDLLREGGVVGGWSGVVKDGITNLHCFN